MSQKRTLEKAGLWATRNITCDEFCEIVTFFMLNIYVQYKVIVYLATKETPQIEN